MAIFGEKPVALCAHETPTPHLNANSMALRHHGSVLNGLPP